MSSGLPVETGDATLPADLVEAGSYATHAAGAEHGLVVLAMGSPYWLVPAEAGFRLLVEPQIFSAAREQLARFDRESLRWPPAPFVDRPALRQADFATPLLWVLAIAWTFSFEETRPDLLVRGDVDSAAIFGRGEWWRAWTALFLHADLSHLVANAVTGFLVFAAVISTLGRVRGWLLLAIAGGVGNLAIAAFHRAEDYRSVGASTAIFAGVGLLAGRALALAARAAHPHRLRLLFVPLAVGCTVLALYGVGNNARVDVGAHVAGFAIGMLAGAMAMLARRFSN